MKKVIFSIFIVCSLKSSAQYAVKLIQFRPTGDMGMVLKQGFTGEIMYLESLDTDEETRMRYGISYISLKPRMDTFPVYGVLTDGSGTKVLPGYEVYHQYSLTTIFGGIDYAPIRKENYYVYGGLDIVFGGVDKKYDHHIESFTDEDFSGGVLMGGLRFRIGGEYMFSDNVGALFEVTRAYCYFEGESILSNNNIGIGVHILFE